MILRQILILGDVHGNLQAMQAVLGSKMAQAADEIWCLGDCENYGANPVQVIEALRSDQRTTVFLAGNHSCLVRGDFDEAAAGGSFTDKALVLAEWTRRQIEAAGLMDFVRGLTGAAEVSLRGIKLPWTAKPAMTTATPSEPQGEDWSWTKSLGFGWRLLAVGLKIGIKLLGGKKPKEEKPIEAKLAEPEDFKVLCVHGSPANPFYGYLPLRGDKNILASLPSVDGANLVVCGHTHASMVAIVRDGTAVEWVDLEMGTPFNIPVAENTVTFLNAGSVGQPRDGSGKASFGLLRIEQDDASGELRLVFIQQERKYDWRAASDAILALEPEIPAEQLPNLRANAKRLEP